MQHTSGTTRPPLLRSAALVTAVIGSGPATLVSLTGPVRDAWDTWVGLTAMPDQRLVAGVLLSSALLLAVVWCWLSACVTAEVLEQVRPPGTGRAPARTPDWRPQLVRSLVAVLLGSAVVVPWSATAHARPGLPVALDGLPVPDRVSGHGPVRDVPPTLTVRVRPGDTLWHIAADRLPTRSGAAVVDRAWRHLYARNRVAVGPDPDLLLPGTRLRVPRHL